MIFQEIETYIEFMAGMRDATGKNTRYWPEPMISLISLASYDINFITSVSEQTITGIAMSDRQAVLAERLIAKYERQLSKHGIEQPNHQNYRHSLRTVNRDKLLSIENNKLNFKFPFNDKIILDIKEFAKSSQGSVLWNKESKAWEFAITEYNLNWVVTYATSNSITVSSQVTELFKQLLEVEQTPYSIELKINEQGKCEIENIPDSMFEYITEHLGFDDLYSLVDNSGVLSYTVNEEIVQILTEQHGDTFIKLCLNKSIDFNPGDTTFKEVIAWAKEVNRLPMVIYNPNFVSTPGPIDQFSAFFAPEEIRVVSLKDSIDDFTLDPNIKLVYTNRVISPYSVRLPLLVSFANLMHGKAKKQWLNQAEKIIFWCPPLPRK
jgi:hypothetical protein